MKYSFMSFSCPQLSLDEMLAFAKQVVERHGGQIWATGNPDGGSRFVFTLPKVAAASPA